MARRHSAKRSETPSVWPPPSSAARSTRAVTSSSAGPNICTRSVKKALRQAWDQDDANKAERLLRNLVRRLEHEEPGVSGSILEGLEEILTVIRLGLPHELRRSLACTNIGRERARHGAPGHPQRQTLETRRDGAQMDAAGLLEAQKTFRRLKAYRQLPILRNALQETLEERLRPTVPLKPS